MTALDTALIAKPEPKRDRFGRYLIPNPSGKPIAYTRATTVADALDDRYNLERWKLRQVAYGLGRRRDLYALAASHNPDDDRGAYDQLVDKALEAAASSAAASEGTALHRFTENLDAGRIQLTDIPDEWRDRCATYQATMAELGVEWLAIEEILVDDRYEVAGTTDRIVRLGGRDLILDLKGLAVDTPIPTPDGWTTMGAIQVGDQVYGRDGRPATVTAKSEIHAKACYRITFDDTTSIIADHDHRWWVTPSQQTERMMTTEEMAALVVSPSTGQRHLQIWNTAPLQAPDVELPIDPYVLGAWLGDGHVKDGSISKPLPELWAEITRRGYDISPEHDATAGTRTVYKLRTALREQGLLWDKHIPAEYLRASEAQRRDLLAGLMDTDGSFNTARRECTFYSTSKRLATEVEELVLSLGYRVTFWEGTRTGFGKTVTCYDVKFRPHDRAPFIAKADRWAGVVKDSTRSRRRLVTSIERVDTVPTQCIAVDSLDQSYLCGHQMLPTHNTGKNLAWSWQSIAIQLAIYANHTATYDPASEQRGPRIDVDTATALVVHLPATGPEAGTCMVYEVDIAAGYSAYLTALEVRTWRKTKDLATPWRPAGTPGPVTPAEMRAALAGRVGRLAANAQALADLRQHWPSDVPRPLPEQPTPDQVAALGRVLDALEARHQLPF